MWRVFEERGHLNQWNRERCLYLVPRTPGTSYHIVVQALLVLWCVWETCITSFGSAVNGGPDVSMSLAATYHPPRDDLVGLLAAFSIGEVTPKLAILNKSGGGGHRGTIRSVPNSSLSESRCVGGRGNVNHN